MLKPRSPQTSFYGSYIYDRIIPQDHLLRKIDQTVDPVSSTGQAFLLSMNLSGTGFAGMFGTGFNKGGDGEVRFQMDRGMNTTLP